MATSAFLNKAYLAYFGRPVDVAGSATWTAASVTEADVENAFSASNESQAMYGTTFNAATVNAIYNNLFGRDAEPKGITHWLDQVLTQHNFTPAGAAMAILNGAANADLVAVTNKLVASQNFSSHLDTTTEMLGYSGTEAAASARAFLATVTATPATDAQIDAAILAATTHITPPAGGTTFALAEESAAGALAMHITGDQNVRIDFTASSNQVKGLDLDGDGVIELNGIENNNPTTLDDGKTFAIVDAASRNPINQLDTTNNFRGDISFDGTGFAGDGVSTDGNIFLGGLGVDRASGGIGNDFMTGGGVAADRFENQIVNGNVQLIDTKTGKLAGTTEDYLFGGRNADFFFTSLSALDFADGDTLDLDGGETADDDIAGLNDTAQDSDWLLLEASDDDEPVVVRLAEKNQQGVITTAFLEDHGGQIDTGDGNDGVDIVNLENVDASGNLYGFLDNLPTVALGEAGLVKNGENVGIGSSAQMQIYGNSQANIIVAGYDNDYVEGGAGNDILMGGRLGYLNNPNLVGITNDGRDAISGGAGNDAILLELDQGTVDGGDGNDTLFITDYTIARPAATEAASLEARLSDGKIRIDLGYADHRGYRGDTLGEFTDHSDEANQTSTSNWVAGTADQTNYKTGTATTITGMESVIATGLGQIDYLAAGSNDPELKFNNQQNFFATTSDLELRGTDGSSIQYVTTYSSNGGLTPAVVTQLYTDYLKAALVADPEANDLLTEVEFSSALTDGGLVLEQLTPTMAMITVATGANTLYAASGEDILEGRSGNDLLSGGSGNDSFVFSLSNSQNLSSGQFASGMNVWLDSGDGVDVIHRQTDAMNNQTGLAGADNIWDGTFERDFGLDETSSVGSSVLKISVTKAGGNVAGDELDDVVNFVSEIVTGVKVAGTFQSITLNSAAIKAATTYQGLTDAINAALDETAFGTDLQATLQSDGTSIFITDAKGRELADTTAEVAGAGVSVNQKANTQTANVFQYGEPAVSVSQDRLIYKAYEDRAMNEGVDDDATLGSTISLGLDSYAEDLVIDFSVENGKVQTRIAEDQSYSIQLKDLKSEDIVKVEVNGVVYELQVNKNLNGTLIGNETNNAFVARLATYINQFMDDDTAAGAIDAAANGDTLILVQRDYHAEETVFMKTPVVTLTNLSGGQVPVSAVQNLSSHEVHLLDFDGQNGALNSDNVLFVGEEFINRATLETAKDAGGALVGSEGMVIDAGADDLAGIVVNLATGKPENFSVHGDDFLLTGKGSDQVTAGTGDDRVEGSLGADTIDGGKNYYAVKVLGEAQARVVVMNEWEAANPASRVTELAGKTISSTTLIKQNESGSLVSGDFDDTLLFQQSDFVAGVTDFTIKLDGFTAVTPTATLRTVEFRNDGAGHVETDLNGDNSIGANITTFSNFENIRTVSGIGRAVAGQGQGNDTLDIAALSTATFGVSYDLTGDATAGEVRFTTDDEVTSLTTDTAASDRTIAADYKEAADVLVIKVDGVENVIGGQGDDLLLIDETEAAKNNAFDGAAGSDRIEYLNDYNDDGASEPTVTVAVGSAGVDTVKMTEGALGLVVATDTLTSVEYIALGGDTAQGVREDDVLDVTAFASGVIVDYTNGEVRTGAAAGSGVQVVIENAVQLENVWADGNDTVIVADADVMNNNARSDEGADAKAAEDIGFMTYLDFDDLNTGATTRKTFEAQVAADEITQVINQNQFTFSLSKVGSDADTDRVDYSNELGRIAVSVGQGSATNPQYVVVDGNSNGDLDDVQSRIDVLESVEQIVAAKGESILDFTTVNEDRQITFQYVVGSNPAENAVIEQTIRIADGAGNTIDGLNAFIEKYTYNKTTAAVADATWNRVEGSDKIDIVTYQGSEDLVNQSGLDHRFTNDVLTLRGGNNEVRYSPIETSITADITVVTEDATTVGVAEGLITADITFQDGIGGALVGGGNHTITSYSSDNSTAAGNLKIEGSQDAEDTVTFNTSSDKVYVLGTSPGVINVNIGTLNSIVLTGFEILGDDIADDVYDFRSLTSIAGLTLQDNVADHDTIKLSGTLGVNFNGSGANTIDLDNLSSNVGGLNFEFDVLDVTGVTASNLILNGGNDAAPVEADPDENADNTDEVVLGVLSKVATIADFESMVMTEATTAAGTSFTFNTSANTLTQGSTTISTSADILSFGGLVLEQTAGYGQSYLADVATGVSVTVAGTASATVHGGDGADTITGGVAADVIRGNGGNDTLDGGIAVETRTINLQGILAAPATLDGVVTLTFDADGGAGGTYAVSVTEGVEIVDGAGNDAIGAALATKITANLAALNAAVSAADPAWNGGASLISATYSADSDLLTFTFTPGVDVTGTIAGTVGGTAGTFAVSAETAANGGDGGADTFVFEATAALNGVDTINNFGALNVATDDLLDFTAFLGAAAVADAAGAVNAAAGDVVLAAETVGVLYNHTGALTAASVMTASTAAFGEVILANDTKAVILTTADLDGASDSTNQAYSVYFVEDTDTTAAQNWVVTLVGTVNSATELTAGNLFAGTDAFV